MMRIVEAVIARFGIGAPSVDDVGLRRIYAAWCAHVPFDNLQKRAWLAERRGPMPGDDARAFFESFLVHDTGGTCWGSSGALHALLRAIGFDARRAVGTMMLGEEPDPARRLNHGTVIVSIGGARWLLDTHILTGAPLRIPEHDGETTSVDGVAAARAERSPRFDCVRVHFDPNNGRRPMSCLIERDEVDDAFCTERHRASESSGPFNGAAYVRRHRRGALVTIALGSRTERDASGARSSPIADRRARDAHLAELGYSAEIVARTPDDASAS
jgi:N-hydroxyarylamine O-acetyltransferase